MKISTVLIGLVLCGCVSQQPESPPELIDVDVFYEEPKIDYEVLDRVDTTRRADNQMDVMVVTACWASNQSGSINRQVQLLTTSSARYLCSF